MLDNDLFALGTTKDGMGIALALYSGMYAYNGWYTITLVTEEVKHPSRNIPLALILSMTLVTTLYLLVNISYYLVLDTEKVPITDC